MAELFKVNAPVRKPLFEGVQGENEARSIQFDVTPWVEELGDGAVTATAKRSQDSQPYPATVTKDGTTVTWKPTSTDTAFAGVGSFQLEYTVDSVLAKTCIWSTMVAPSLDPAGDPPDPYDNWLAEMREIAADAIQAAQDADESADDAQAEVYEAEAWAKGTKNGTPVSSSDAQYQNNSKYFAEESYKNAEAWAVGQRGGVDVPSTDPTYENNAKYYAEQSAENQYGAYIVKSASGAIASFADGGDDIPMKSLKVAIVPKQAGSGDPSPSNVRPISGWTDADVHVAERNLFAGAVDEMIPLFLPKLTDVVASASTACVIHYYDINGTEIDYWTLSLTQDGRTYRAFRIKSTADCYYVKFTGNATNFQLEKGTTPTAYEAPTTTPVPLGQTVYGGEVDVTTGVLTIDRIMVSGWTQFNQNNGYKAYRADNLPKGQGYNLQNEPMCNMINEFGSFSSGSMDRNIIQVPDANATNSFMALDENIDPTTVQFTYKIMTPQTVQLTPTQVATLLGTNNVWADCGSVEVEYRADPTLAYAELQALILENI